MTDDDACGDEGTHGDDNGGDPKSIIANMILHGFFLRSR